MDLQFYGANCISVTHKNTRVVIDDNLSELGKKSVLKADEVALFTDDKPEKCVARLVFNGPGEYEVGDISIVGINAKPHMNDDSNKQVTMYKLFSGDISVLVSGHILGELNEEQREQIGSIDVLFVPVGNGGYTLDPVGALKLIKDIEPKIVIPTHYKDTSLKYPIPQIDLATALKELAMEPKETVSKLKVKVGDLSDLTQLIVLEAQ